MDTITPEMLAQALAESCRTFTEEVTQKVEAGIDRIAEQALSDVKERSPVYKGKNKKTPKGRYRRSWRVSKEKSRGTYTVTVHQSDREWSLIHLLEYGHLSRNGTTRAKAIPHFNAANEKAEREVERLMEEL